MSDVYPFTGTRAVREKEELWFLRKNPTRVIIGALVCAILLSLAYFAWPSGKEYRPTTIGTVTYTARPLDTLFNISRKYPGMLPIDVAMMNNASQLNLYPSVCTQNAGDEIASWPEPMKRGAFCNSRLALYWQHTLVPGTQLRLPATSYQHTPASELVSKMGAGNLVLLIDGNPSSFQRNLDAAVAMHIAMQQTGKHLVGIWIYNQGSVFEYKHGSHAYPLGGKFAGLNGALNMLKMQPAADLAQIALVSGDAGKSWDLDMAMVDGGKPIFGLCTSPVCYSMMTKLTRKTGGQIG